MGPKNVRWHTFTSQIFINDYQIWYSASFLLFFLQSRRGSWLNRSSGLFLLSIVVHGVYSGRLVGQIITNFVIIIHMLDTTGSNGVCLMHLCMFAIHFHFSSNYGAAHLDSELLQRQSYTSANQLPIYTTSHLTASAGEFWMMYTVSLCGNTLCRLIFLNPFFGLIFKMPSIPVCFVKPLGVNT